MPPALITPLLTRTLYVTTLALLFDLAGMLRANLTFISYRQDSACLHVSALYSEDMTAIKTVEAGERTQTVRYIDMTPSWIGVLPILIETKDHPDSRKELEKMAKLADRLNTPLHKSATDLLAELKALRAYVEKYHNTVDASGYLASADTAIDRAEGRTQ